MVSLGSGDNWGEGSEGEVDTGKGTKSVWNSFKSQVVEMAVVLDNMHMLRVTLAK